MSKLYKIETYCENGVKQMADIIIQSGGKCVIRGWAVVTDHVFTQTQTNQVLSLVARITDELTDDDHYSWLEVNRQAA